MIWRGCCSEWHIFMKKRWFFWSENSEYFPVFGPQKIGNFLFVYIDFKLNPSHTSMRVFLQNKDLLFIVKMSLLTFINNNRNQFVSDDNRKQAWVTREEEGGRNQLLLINSAWQNISVHIYALCARVCAQIFKKLFLVVHYILHKKQGFHMYVCMYVCL